VPDGTPQPKALGVLVLKSRVKSIGIVWVSVVLVAVLLFALSWAQTYNWNEPAVQWIWRATWGIGLPVLLASGYVIIRRKQHTDDENDQGD
jgi:hypothetical protein